MSFEGLILSLYFDILYKFAVFVQRTTKSRSSFQHLTTSSFTRSHHTELHQYSVWLSTYEGDVQMFKPRMLHLLTWASLSIILFHFSFYPLNQTKAAIPAPIFPGSSWTTASPSSMEMNAAALDQAVSYAGGSGYIIRSGRVVRSWGSASTLYSMRSTTKSIGSIALALALAEGRLSLNDSAIQRHPSFGVPPNFNTSTGWLPGIRVRHLATHTAGFDKPGGYESLLFQSGTRWHYSDGGLNWLAEILTLAFQQDLNTVLFSRVLTPIGIRSSDLNWRSNLYRSDRINGIKNREFGSGINANVNAMARIGYLFLRNGNWNGQQLIPQSFVNMARASQSGVVGLPEHASNISFNASDHYGLLWWNNADGTIPGAPRDTYWAWGLGESLIVVYPSLDIVAVRAGNALQSTWAPNYAVVRPFIEPIAASVTGAPPSTPTPGVPSGSGTTIEIFAAPIGTPRLELRINNQAVQSFNVSGGNYSTRNFVRYTYTSPNTVSINQIRVAFVNDSAGNDVFVDRVVVNGVAYESEASTTYSTGVYASGRCQSGGGYFRSERLSCNGYFQYVQQGSANTTIEIFAAPSGTPRMELRISDQTVATFNVSGGNYSTRSFVRYTYTSTGSIAPGQIRVAFVNDSATNDLFVDRIVVNGVAYESEAPTTYSTGVYASGRCQSSGGFYRKEKLACNGYFWYAQDPSTFPSGDNTALVQVDVWPADDTNQIPVVILSNPAFDAQFVNVETVTLSGAAPVAEQPGWQKFTLTDQNQDGRTDMVVRFNRSDIALASGEVVLLGETYAGQRFQGADWLSAEPSPALRLRAPENGSVLNRSIALLSWGPVSTDTCYAIQIDDQADFSSPIEEATVVTATQYQTAPLADGLYYWRVQTGGTCLNVTPGSWSEVRSFTVASDN